MASFRFSLLFLVASSNVFFHDRTASAFSATAVSSFAKRSQLPHRELLHGPDFSKFSLSASFKQLPGESSTEFIKRITSQSNEILNQQKLGELSEHASDNEDSDVSKPVGKYQRIEEWDAERTAKGELSWEEKVQFDGQMYGNQLKQDSILRRQLGGFR
mmetsp:Transcript_11717/g.27842  ORF Transcript_11717/g.27842 Transcript_11717/m.27842 type:complete len:159 (+) Transcript_11717:351-827(+)|eukprot:CAMPEP_0197184946 /NCGR_PEP_ID=MMETSP1423-20130617/10925_1 /TAXON_ID=476441 /ORGANISM="Pseudo-nitzschia heimii, Strain UNC1101" /LENGTH=158 /DNA_ID=CAMNT_0042635899 /DNA_START=259 /DNA_END=735 /DNA_ORIENTATION=+